MIRRPSRHPAACAIVPPHVLLQVAERGTAEEREAALRTLALSAAMRERRAQVGAEMLLAARGSGAPPSPAPERVTVYDARHGTDGALPGSLVRGQGDAPAADLSVNQAWEGADRTYAFYLDVHGRVSIDGRGMEIVSSVHYGVDFDNAFWNGSQMVYGDGSGRIFRAGSLTTALDVIAHELTHGVTQYTAALEYRGQSGALNESISDVFGSLVKQRRAGQRADQADWLIGAGILGTALHGVALRSMAAPGTAYEGDPQPATMAGYVDLPDDADPSHDNGGVHINSGIPNHAFYLAATAIGGNAWEAAGPIWYRALTRILDAAADFTAAADATIKAAAELHGASSAQAAAVRDAWTAVGVAPGGGLPSPAGTVR